MEQKIISDYFELNNWLQENVCKKVLLVCDDSIKYMESLNQHLEQAKDLGVEIFPFKDFQPNPQYESVVNGVELFRRVNCDSIIAVGGGSAMDVAKCIKAYVNMSCNGDNGGYLKQAIIPDDIPFLAMPTTAGTGSEATRYAVIYFDGNKQSITSDALIPQTVLMNPDVLKTLPMYQRKATMMDAFCHAIESFWSVNSTDESKGYSRDAIKNILAHMDGYLQNTEEGNAGMLLAAHMAGKAINITQTTAGHAMCYKLTSIFGIAHGHAAALCVKELFEYMISNVDKCSDKRGRSYLENTFVDIALAMGCSSPQEAAVRFGELFKGLELPAPKAGKKDFEILKKSVNPVRLKNNPIALDEDTIDMLYHKILD